MADLTKYDEQFKMVVIEETEKKEYKNLEDGEYIAYITRLEILEHKEGSPRLVWSYEIEGGRRDTKCSWLNDFDGNPSPKNMERIKKDFNVLGISNEDSSFSDLVTNFNEWLKENRMKIKLEYVTKPNQYNPSPPPYKNIKGLAD